VTDPLLVQPTACPTCPYLRKTPAGIWSADEYVKLSNYDEIPPTECARAACENMGMHPHRDLAGLY
jgi:hypothetical protein